MYIQISPIWILKFILKVKEWDISWKKKGKNTSYFLVGNSFAP